MNDPNVSLKAGDTLFDEGDKSDYMYIVSYGAIQISRRSSHGRVVLATLKPGDFFGEMAIVARTRRTARAMALMDSRLTAVSGSRLELLFKGQPEVAAELIRTLVKRLHYTSDRLVDECEKVGMILATDRIISESSARDTADQAEVSV